MSEEQFEAIKEEWNVIKKYDDLLQLYNIKKSFNNKVKCNFDCHLTNDGWWAIDKCKGKWLFMTKPKGSNPTPTLMDSINFITGLLKAEERNDRNSIVNRPPHYDKTFNLIRDILGTEYNDYSIVAEKHKEVN